MLKSAKLPEGGGCERNLESGAVEQGGLRAVLQELEPSFDNPVAFGFFNLPLEFPMSYHNKTDLTILGSPSERNKAPFDLPLIFRFPRSKTPAILPKNRGAVKLCSLPPFQPAVLLARTDS